jgi:4-hydroxybenzoate polyprenyltransferase
LLLFLCTNTNCLKLLSSFFRLVRWPNLVFIALTQFLFSYCIIEPVFNNNGIHSNINWFYWSLLCISSVLIAAAGYIINDYFDLNIDRINKPEKLVVEKIIKRRWVIIWHLILSFIGIVIGFYIDVKTPTRFIGLANTGCVLLLFLYSISLKKKLLAGNIVISLLTAWVVLVIPFAETSNLLTFKGSYAVEKITRLTFLYAAFAFIISLIREIVKDMEDIEGDRKYGCTTMPISWGIHVSKVFVAVWIIVLIALLLLIQVYVMQFGWYISAFYCIAFVIVPLGWILNRLMAAQTPKDYHKISTAIKLVMFTGILSMIFFSIYS